LLAPSERGADGTVGTSSIQPGTLDNTNKNNYPRVLLRVIKRQAEDLLWRDDVREGRKALRFLKWVTRGLRDAREINKGICIPDKVCNGVSKNGCVVSSGAPWFSLFCFCKNGSFRQVERFKSMPMKKETELSRDN